MKYTILILFFLFAKDIIAQRHDNNWLIGYEGGIIPNDEFGIAHLSFSEGSLKIEENGIFWGGFHGNDCVFSDSVGNLVATFNGYRINDKSWSIMQNGDSLWYEEEPNLFGYSDGDIIQAGLFLPWPEHPDSLFLFYPSQGNAKYPTGLELACMHLQYALIRLSGNGGLGAVIKKREVVLEDTIQYGRLLAVKHANGRDWWLPINEINTNRYYHYLIDPSGIHLVGQQSIGAPVIDGLSQAAFSPDGRFLAVYNSISSTVGVYLDVYEFDRCEGLLSNHRQLHYTSGNFGGCAIDPNSRYLFVSFNTQIYQYDLYNDDLEGSRILIAEYVPPPPGILPETFFSMQLAPDDKIYISSVNTVKSLHVIHAPDEPGINCQFERVGIKLPIHNNASVTYNPYFRLGPLDGSPCDTLGLDNRPVAWWRYEQDTLDPLQVAFRDLSYYEPTYWHWDFGDGSGSTERHPTHQFDSAGVYQVCLIVSNTNSADTLCRTLYLGVSAVDNPVLQSQVQVWPNPFRDPLSVALNVELRSPEFRLYDQLGRLVHRERPAYGLTEMAMPGLPAGMYFWELWAGGERVKSGKVVKIE